MGGVRRHGHGYKKENVDLENFDNFLRAAKLRKKKKQSAKMNYPMSESFPHPMDAAIKVVEVQRHQPSKASSEPIGMNTALTISGIPRDLQSIESRVAWAVQSAHVKQNLGAIKEEKQTEAMAGAIKRCIAKLGIEVEDKIFSKEEMEQIKELDPDYVAHLIANPEELKKTIERYGNAKKASKELVAEVYSPPRVVESAARYGLSPGWSLDLTQNDPMDNTP